MAEFFALLTTAITEPNPGTLANLAQNRRQDVAQALRLKATEIRSGGYRGGVPSAAERVRDDKAAGLDHLALLIEHHEAFPNIPDHVMPPFEFCRWRPRVTSKGFGRSILADCG